MLWRLGTLAAVLAWLFLASPAVLAAAERADTGIEVRNGTRTQNLAHLTRTLLSLQGFNVVQIGNYIDFGVEATVIYYRAEAEQVARSLQSEIFPGARLEASSTLKNGVDLKVLLGSDLLAQPRMRARLLGEEMPAPPPAVKTPTPEPGPPPRSIAAKETVVPVIISAPAKAEPGRPPSPAPPPLPAAASAANSGASPRHTDSRGFLSAAERADTGIEVRNGTRTQNLAHLTRTLLSLQGFNVVQIGNYIDFGVEATVIYYRTGAEKVARALQSEIFPGAKIEESPNLKNGVDLKVLLGHDLEVQPRMLARLHGEELAAPPPAVKAPTPEPGPTPQPTVAKETAVPVIARAPATAEPIPAAAAPESVASQRRIALAAAERADTGIEVRNGTRTQNLAHLTRTLLSLQGFNVVQIGNYIDFGVEATVIYYRTGAEKVARALQSEIFPGAGIEASSSLKNGTDIKVLLGHDLEVQPRMLARLHGEELAAPPPAVKAPMFPSGPLLRSTAAKETAAPAIVRAPATAEPALPPSQAPAVLPAAASAAESGAGPRHTDSGDELHNDNVATNLPTPSQPDSPSAVPEAFLVGPRRGWSRHLRLLGQIEETAPPESDLDAIQKTCQGLVRGEAPAHEFDGIVVAAGQAAAEKEAGEVAVDVSQVSQDQGGIPAPALQPAAPKTAEVAAAGDIQRYRDALGVLHLSNAAPSQPTPSQPDSPERGSRSNDN